MSLDNDVLIIGGGMSGIGTAVQLIRTHGTRNFEIIEKSNQVGGTWWTNSYPGCGCDVPSHFYSYSFALNPNWSQKYAMQPEIYAYFEEVAKKYDLRPHVRFHSVVEKARWEGETASWVVTCRNLNTKQSFQRRCKILISAVGALSVPKKCDIPGASRYQGRMFHSAEWDHSFNWEGKEVITIGNGCSATQFVPVISEGKRAVKKVTQFSRQAHWLAERPNPQYSTLFKYMLRWVPGLIRLYRAKIYWEKESDFSGFDINTGSKIRAAWTKDAADYIRKNAPAKYREALVPKSEIGCKRRVNDTDYLLCLHRDNVELVYDDPIQEIVEDGVKTKSGRLVKADAIVLANGFETQQMLFPMEIYGEKGVSLNDHWKQFSNDTPSAYFGTCISGFPNFFVMMGPNTLSGHLSVIYTTECQINFTMRVIKPVLQALAASRSNLPNLVTKPDTVVVKAEAERRDNDWIQTKARQLVWATGCTSWFVDPASGRNFIMYPDWQYKFWARSFFIAWRDLDYTRSPKPLLKSKSSQKTLVRSEIGLTTLMMVACLAGAAIYAKEPLLDFVKGSIAGRI